MTDAPTPATANSTPEIWPPGPVGQISGSRVAAEASTGVLAAPGEWVANVFTDSAYVVIRYLAQPTSRRAGMACVQGPAAATERHTAEALAAMGLVGIWRVPSP